MKVDEVFLRALVPGAGDETLTFSWTMGDETWA
jgi:hypothetical protein